MTPSGSVHGDSRRPRPIKLAVAREDALREVDALLQEGRQISAMTLGGDDELTEATGRKQEWIGGVSYQLSKIASEGAAAEYMRVVPGDAKAGAPFESRTEQFYNEMNQRLERLMAVRKLIEGDSVALGTSAAKRPPQPRPVASEPAPPAVEEPPSGVESVELNLVDDESGDTRMPGAAATPATAGGSPVPPAKQPRPTPAPAPTPASASPTTSRSRSTSKLSQTKVLLIQCSRNGTARQAICRFGNQMNLWLEIVDYNPDQPHSIVDQLYNHRDAQFAIVYWGEPAGRELPGSAHPERYVGFALGFALGRLGRGRVFILGSTTTPPLPGFTRVLVAQLDSTGGWQIQLARRMKAAGVDIDLNRLT